MQSLGLAVILTVAFLQLNPMIVMSLESSGNRRGIQGKKCKFLLEACSTLHLCPESHFHVPIQNQSRCSNFQRLDVISTINRKSLECSEYKQILGVLVPLGRSCYFKSHETYYSPPDHCLISASEALVCTRTFLLPKCCEVTEAYADISGKCQPTAKSYLPQVGDGRTKNSENGSKYLSFVIQPSHLRFPRNTSTFTGHAKFYLEESRVIFSPLTGVFLRGEYDTLNGNYCVEQAFASFGGGWNDPIRLFYDSNIELQAKKYAVIVGVIWLVSIPFDLATASLHAFVLKRSVHGALLASYLIAGSSVRFMGAAIQFNFYNEPFNSECTFLDIFQKIMYMSTLSWMTLLNFNMWIAFRKLNHSRGKRHGLLCAYLSYLAFATIFPCIVVFVTWKIGHFYRAPESPACVLYGLISLLTFSTPLVVLVIINFFLFLRTSLNIKGYQKSTEVILKNSHPVNRKTYLLFSKLFLMTGPIWVVRLILLFSHLKSWYLSISGAVLEGIFISPDLIFFVLVFADPDTWKALQAAFCKRDGLDHSETSLRDSRHSTLHRTYSSIPRTATSSCVTTPGSASGGVPERY